MFRNFIVTLKDDDFKSVIDKKGNVQYYHKKLSLQEVIELIDKAVKIEKSRYGFDVYGNGESVYLRFGNVTVKSKDDVVGFVRKNW